MLTTGSTLQPYEFAIIGVEKSPFRAEEPSLDLLLGVRLLRLSGLGSRRGSLGLSRLGLGGLYSSWLGLDRLGSGRGTLLRLGLLLLLGLCRRSATFLGVAARSHFSGWKEEEEEWERGMLVRASERLIPKSL